MQPHDSILFSKRACWINTLFVVLISLLLSFLAFLDARNFVVVNFFLAALVSSVCVGMVFAILSNRMLIKRLKQRYPARAEKIEDYRFGKHRVQLWYNHVIHEEDMLPFVEGDPRREQMLAERRRLERFGLIWQWGGVVFIVLVGMICDFFR